MIYCKTPSEIKILRIGGKRLSAVLKRVARKVKPGVSTADLDKLAFRLIKGCGGRPSFLNYQPDFASNPFPASLCVSINETVVHGIPAANKILKEGDVVSLDVGMEYEGLFTDMAVTVGVGRIEPIYARMMRATREALQQAIKAVKLNNTLGDVGYAVQKRVERDGFVIVNGLVGHGVGYAPHEEPAVFNYGSPRQGLKLREGMVIAIEPMVTLENGDILEKPDGSYATANGQVACHFEHTVAVTKRGSVVITK